MSKGKVLVVDDDPFVLKSVRATRDGLNQHGFNAELTEINGHTHNYYGRSSEINKAVWAFLQGKRLDPFLNLVGRE